MPREEVPTPARVPQQQPARRRDDELTPVLAVPKYIPGSDGKRPCLVALSGPLIGEVFVIGSGLVAGREAASHLRLIEEGVSRRHARFETEAKITTVVDLGSTNGTWVKGERIKSWALADGDRVRIGQTTVLKFTYQDPLEEACARQLLEAALRDPLTRCFNRRYFLQRLAAEIAYADRHRAPLALLFVDIDHFKAINDTFGHPVGDAVLQRVTEVTTNKIRIDDVLARYGGEEFAVIARDTTLEGGMRLGERLRAAVAESLFAHLERPIEVRVSVGVAAMPHEDLKDAESFIVRADEALYRAKRGGRNRVSP